MGRSFEGNNKALNDKVSTSTLIMDYSSKADTAQAITSATETLEAKFRQKFGDLWTNSSATLDSTRYTKLRLIKRLQRKVKSSKPLFQLVVVIILLKW